MRKKYASISDEIKPRGRAPEQVTLDLFLFRVRGYERL